MKYMGSKNRIAKHILPIILRDRKEGQWYVEPFVGGANLIDKVDGSCLGTDINQYLIDALTYIKDNPAVLPRDSIHFTEADYNRVRENKNEYHMGIVGYVGFALSYSGKWFGGWCRDGAGKRDYVSEAFRNAQKQHFNLQNILFQCKNYLSLELPPESIIYCDPPYAGTTKYKDDFIHDDFWNWCRNKSRQGHTVFVSEYKAPEDFECIWSKQQVSSLTQDTGSKKATERLFKI